MLTGICFVIECLSEETLQEQRNLSNRFYRQGYRCLCTAGFKGKHCKTGVTVINTVNDLLVPS